MFSEQFFDLLLDFGDDWKVDTVKADFLLEEVDIFVSYVGSKAECSDTMEMCSIYDYRESRRWRHLDTMQFKTYINCKVPRIKSSKGVRTVAVPWADSLFV